MSETQRVTGHVICEMLDKMKVPRTTAEEATFLREIISVVMSEMSNLEDFPINVRNSAVVLPYALEYLRAKERGVVDTELATEIARSTLREQLLEIDELLAD